MQDGSNESLCVDRFWQVAQGKQSMHKYPKEGNSVF